MPPTDEPLHDKTLRQVVEELGLYPAEAFEFVSRGLAHTVEQLHGPDSRPRRRVEEAAEVTRHISGQQLCHGLREYALGQWGLLARTVLRRWNITSTLDFGRIVFAMVDSGMMRKTEEDSIDDFKNVFDFSQAFESGYRIESKP
jgi:uncharacterized repeat protein (TIGR04138 family)